MAKDPFVHILASSCQPPSWNSGEELEGNLEINSGGMDSYQHRGPARTSHGVWRFVAYRAQPGNISVLLNLLSDMGEGSALTASEPAGWQPARPCP